MVFVTVRGFKLSRDLTTKFLKGVCGDASQWMVALQFFMVYGATKYQLKPEVTLNKNVDLTTCRSWKADSCRFKT